MRSCILFLLMLSAPLIALAPPYYEPLENEPRSFEVGISQTQIDDLYYLLTSLAFNSYEDILADRIQLQAAMRRIDIAHPLQYLAAIFADRWLIRSLHAIHHKEWLWRHFSIKIKRSLTEEAELDNMHPQYVLEFSARLNLDFETTMNMVERGDWDALMDALLTLYPNDED